MLDMRYHVVSLVAVFLALGLGILLGTVVVDKGLLVEQQKALVKNLETSYDEIRNKNRSLEKELETERKRNEEFQRSVFGSLVAGKLEERKVAVITTTPISEAVQKDLVDTMSEGGADISTINIIFPDFEVGDKKMGEKLRSLFPEEKLSREELMAKILERLAGEVGTPSELFFLKELAGMGLIGLSAEGNLPADSIIIFGGSPGKSTAAKLDVPLITGLKELGLTVVGVETMGVKTSYITSYKEAGVATVDNVDTLPGRVALVYALRGRMGNYGVKPTAQSLLPVLEESTKGEE